MGKIKILPNEIFDEYRKGNTFKESLGRRGIFEQTKMNERFFSGDQWHGLKLSEDRPLVRRNLIKRIGDYKLSIVTASPVAVNYTADGVPDNNKALDDSGISVDALAGGLADFEGVADDIEISFIMRKLSDYFKITAERVKLEGKKEDVARNAYISGTGILYTYWDSGIETGLYVDDKKEAPIKGDIAVAVLDIENVVFAQPNCDDIESQPYIIISQRRDAADVKREAKLNGITAADIEKIKGDGAEAHYNSGDIGELEPADSGRVTVLTKFYKEWDDKGGYRLMGVKVCENVVIRKPFDLKIKHYPLAKFSWDKRRSCIYGESEITHLIPNQIAVNRALTASVWAVMMCGMPITVVNGDIVSENITNTPGQIIKVYGDSNDIASAVHHVSPPSFNGQLQQAVENLAGNTLSDSGANDTALGNFRPDNASAIIQMREAALAPMQLYQNRFYDFLEDVARIWADFWIHLYGDRKIRTEDKSGTAYIPFHAARYENLLINARIDVGASTMWSTSVVVGTLDGLLDRGHITFKQYLERLPGGLIPDVTGLIGEIEAASANPSTASGPPPLAGEVNSSTAGGLDGMGAVPLGDEDILSDLAASDPALYEKFQSLPQSQQQAILAKAKGSSLSSEETGDMV